MWKHGRSPDRTGKRAIAPTLGLCYQFDVRVPEELNHGI